MTPHKHRSRGQFSMGREVRSKVGRDMTDRCLSMLHSNSHVSAIGIVGSMALLNRRSGDCAALLDRFVRIDILRLNLNTPKGAQTRLKTRVSARPMAPTGD